MEMAKGRVDLVLTLPPESRKALLRDPDGLGRSECFSLSDAWRVNTML